MLEEKSLIQIYLQIIVGKHLALQPYLKMVKSTAYHEIDLITFRNKVVSCCPDKSVNDSDDHITLAQIMLINVGADEIKALVVAAILDGKLISIGSAGEGVGAMLFNRNEVKLFILTSKHQYFGSMAVVSAYKILNCDPEVVRGLFNEGLLEGIKKLNGIFIQVESLKTFGKQYASCIEIAKKHQISIRMVINHCNYNMIKIHLLQRAYNKCAQPFVDRQFDTLTWQV